MTDTPDLRDQIAQLVGVIQRELELARSGDGYEEQAVAEEIVAKCVAPLLAAKDQEIAEWKQAAETEADALDQAVAEHNEAFTRVRRERDEARARVAELEAAYDNVVKLLQGTLTGTTATADRLAAEVHRVMRERDKARAEVDKLRADLAHVTKVKSDAMDRLAEANEALEAWERTVLGDIADEPAPSSSDLAGLAAREATPLTSDEAVTAIKDRYSDALDALTASDTAEGQTCAHCGRTRPELSAWAMGIGPLCHEDDDPTPTCYQQATRGRTPKPRRDERINPAWLYTEPRDGA